MRKNGINRELRPIEGGVCAPEGFLANGVACGIREDGELDLAMIFSKRRCAVGCAFASGNTVGAPVKVSRHNMRTGYVRAVLVNSGVANAVADGGEDFANAVCDLLFPYGIERGETVVASTGKIGRELRLQPYREGIPALWKGLGEGEEFSRRAARAITSEDSFEKQLSFAFDLGDYPCKIGAIFKGGAHTSPNTSTFLAFLTTDVNISSEMLRKALVSEVKETVNLLNLDGISSPNDTVCIMANGRAGNYKIDCEDSEYKKFKTALRGVLTEICRTTARDGAQKVLRCKVTGGISKEVTRSVSKAVVGSAAFKNSVARQKIDVNGLVYATLSAANAVKTEKLRLFLGGGEKELSLYEDGRGINPSAETLQPFFDEEEITLVIRLGEGNFQSTAFSSV